METANPQRTLVLIPGTVNYFYNLAGRRVAESLRDLGFAVDVRSLTEPLAPPYDWCVLSTISEVTHAYGSKTAAFEKLAALRKSCRAMTSILLDSVQGPWYRKIADECRMAGIRHMLDLSLHDQREQLPEGERQGYHYLPAGLTTSETRSIASPPDDDRPIPWAFVGHVTPSRTALVERLVREVDPRGFVYIPECAPYTEKGSPHLNGQQFLAVLRRARYQIWCSHHGAFYMESERFRMSLLAGGIPIKVLAKPLDRPDEYPFSYLMIEEGDLGTRLRSFDFEALRQRFRDDFRQIKSLKDGLAHYLKAVGVLKAESLPSRGSRVLETAA